MNRTFKILILAFFGFLSQTKLVAQVCPKKLPIPDKTFLKKVLNSDNPEISYFEKYFGKISEPKVLKTFSESQESCKVIYNFKNGITYQEDVCSESGAHVIIVFPSYCKSELDKYVEWFFNTKGNVWNKNKTLYQPKEDGDAGCYIEIKQNKKGFYIEYYCGC